MEEKQRKGAPKNGKGSKAGGEEWRYHLDIRSTCWAVRGLERVYFLK